VSPRDEHDECEADVRQELHGVIFGIEPPERGRADDHACDHLTDDHRNAQARRQGEQRAEETYRAQQRQGAEVHVFNVHHAGKSPDLGALMGSIERTHVIRYRRLLASIDYHRYC
jgi:hypothetical protein